MSTVISKEGLAHLKRHEGYRKHIYKCTSGFQTIGYGLNLDVGLDEELAAAICEYMANRCDAQLMAEFVWYKTLNQRRKDVLINMAFNLGMDGLKGFVNTLGYIAHGNFDKAAEGMLKSKWATQVGSRAKFLADQMRMG
jgi:lysozyme